MRNQLDARQFVRELAPALRQAASIARALEGRVANRPKRDEATAVKAALTVADIACQEALLVPLFECFPEVRLAAEEDTPSVARFPQVSDHTVVIDPIDGTLHFYLEDRGPYAVMLGLAERGEYEAGLVALPRERLFFSAVRGQGGLIARGDSPPRRTCLDADGDRIYISHDLPEDAADFLREKGFEPVPASGGAISVAPLVPGVRAGLRLMRSTPSVSIRGRVGALVSAEAGALLQDETGAPFPVHMDARARALLVATNDADLTLLHDALGIALVTEGSG
ncbi:MAG: hypothetical protein HRU01_16075 [Myxococcales bacterium]|nr:hypothetical protein [Myxococcales bacterium]